MRERSPAAELGVPTTKSEWTAAVCTSGRWLDSAHAVCYPARGAGVGRSTCAWHAGLLFRHSQRLQEAIPMSRKRLVWASRWIAAVFLISLASQAAAGVSIVLPRPDDLVGGANIACVVEFSRTARPVTRLDFLVDGQVLASKSFGRPTSESGATFVWDATGVPSGKHTLTVRALSGTTTVASDTVEVVVANDAADAVPPQVHIFSPKPGSVVKGRVPINIHAADNDAVAMVSLFIDKELKLLQNIAPFQYVWDTTRYPNGPHTIEVWAYDRAQNKAEGRPVVVRVANETGRTDLQEHPEAQPQPAQITPSGTNPTAQQPTASPAQPQTPPSPPAEAKPLVPRDQLPSPAQTAASSTPKPRTSPPEPATATQAQQSQRDLPPAKVLMAKAPQPQTTGADLGPRPTAPRSVQPAAPTRASAAPAPALPKPVVPKPTPPAPAVSLPQQGAPSPRLIAKAVIPQVELRQTPFAPRPAQPKPIAAARPVLAKADVPKPPVTTPPRAQSPISVTRPIHAKPAPKHLAVMLNDAVLPLDVPPALSGGKVFIPLRQVLERAGGIVMWLPAQKVVRAQAGQKRIQVAIGSRQAVVDGQSTRLAAPAFLRNGRTMVPARFMEQALDLTLVYDPAQKLVRLYLR